ANFTKSGAKEILESTLSQLEQLKIEYTQNDENSYNDCDVVIIIGGDGTIIHHAKKAAFFNKPVIGINAGRVGFLSSVEKWELNKLSCLKSGEYQIEERMLLHVEYNGKTYNCLNDAVISKSLASRMLDLDVSVNSGSMSYRADGLIAATPTGSTAYSLSAGGPLVEPDLSAIILTPICSQWSAAKSIMLSQNNIIKIKVRAPENTLATLTVDGESAIEVENDGEVVISKENDISVKFIKISNSGFYDIFATKQKSGDNND
ncbi:MAG: NAD(+)/NADH kinase, partial [Oscillospiraceae bacterium]|nr:NAD(+)/NADH kinase [Candidatus Equicaccousia limihippi]